MKYLLLLIALSVTAQAKTFEIFDGQIYNGLFYPLVDIIEWGEADGELPHIEFHIHQKDKQIELTAIPGEKNGKKVLWIVYDLRFRNERICRHVLAPFHFKEGMKVYAYKDSSDPDYQNFHISSFPVKKKNLVEYAMPDYAPCTDEFASNKPDTSAPAARTASPGAPQGAAPVAGVAEKKDPKNIGVDYDNAAVPFSF